MTDALRALNAQLRAGRWVEVEGACQERIAGGGDPDGELHALRARALFRLGYPAACHQAAEHASERGASWRIDVALAEARLACGEPGQARALLAPLLPSDPSTPIPPDSPTWSQIAHPLATVLRACGEAERGYGLALELVAVTRGATPRGPLDLDEAIARDEALVLLGWMAWSCGRTTEARSAFEQGLRARRARSAERTQVAEALDGLGVCHRTLGEPFEAVARHREALGRWREALGPDSPAVAACRHRLAHALHRTGDFEAARESMAEALLLTAEHFGRDHVDTWITRFELARYEIDCGDFTDGFARMARARRAVAERLGAQHPVVQSMDRYL